MDADTQARAARAAYAAALPPGELVEFSLMPFDRLDVPCHTVTFFPPDGRTRGGIGYGATEGQAHAGAFGEMIEEYTISRGVERMTRWPGSYRDMTGKHGVEAVIDPRTLCLDAGSQYSRDMPLRWARVERYLTGEEAWVPMEFVACYRGDLDEGRSEPLITPITNGNGAGLSRAQAVAHGLLELLQRDGNSVRYRALARGDAVDLASITDPASRTLLDRYAAAGVDVRVKIVGTDFDMVNFSVVGMDRASGAGTLIASLGGGEAVHPSAVVALRKALLEFASSRARLAFFQGPLERVEAVAPVGYLARIRAGWKPEHEEARALRSMRDWISMGRAEIRARLEHVLRVDQEVPFASLPDQPDLSQSKDDVAALVVERLEAAGLPVYVADFSHLVPGVYAVKMIVPGLEAETMSYGRVGERNVRRLIEDGGDLAGTGALPPGARRVCLTEEAEERLGGSAWLDWLSIERVVEPLYSLYREPGRHGAPFADALLPT